MLNVIYILFILFIFYVIYILHKYTHLYHMYILQNKIALPQALDNYKSCNHRGKDASYLNSVYNLHDEYGYERTEITF